MASGAPTQVNTNITVINSAANTIAIQKRMSRPIMAASSLF
jgi:hypothetical protein